MSNYHLEPADKPQALTPQALRVACARTRCRASRAGTLAPPLDRRRDAACGCTEVAAGSIGFLWPNLKGGFGGIVEIGTLADIKAANSVAARSPQGFPAYFQDGARLRHARRPLRQEFVPGRGQDRRRHGAQRPGALPALPAPRLQAQPVPQELLVRVPLPRLALRPARDQGARRAVRPGAAQHGPLLDHGRRRRHADRRHVEDHPRAAARRGRPARASSRRRVPSAAYDRSSTGDRPRGRARAAAARAPRGPASPSRARSARPVHGAAPQTRAIARPDPGARGQDRPPVGRCPLGRASSASSSSRCS